ncbi:MAG: hypothetical protein JJU45_00910 [Acidimicrobiia bacterium]|nr:hypothetical protein [Acidimicrobiia bacterium]
MARTCPRCGHVGPDAAIYCAACGADVSVPAATDAPSNGDPTAPPGDAWPTAPDGGSGPAHPPFGGGPPHAPPWPAPPGAATPGATPEGQGYPSPPGHAPPGPPPPGAPYPGQPYAGQPYPGQPAPGQQYPGQPYPGQPYPGQPYPGQGWATGPPTPPGNGYSTAAIVLGAIAVLFCPILLGPAGLVCAAIGKSKGEPRANIGFIVAGVGFVVGMVLGVLVWNLGDDPF